MYGDGKVKWEVDGTSRKYGLAGFVISNDNIFDSATAADDTLPRDRSGPIRIQVSEALTIPCCRMTGPLCPA
jgi:hypothetical protein